jgi:hypothetical protein
VWHILGRDVNQYSGLRITPDPWCAVVKDKATESADLYALTFGDTLAHRVENHFRYDLSVGCYQVRVALCEPLDQFTLRHCCS